MFHGNSFGVIVLVFLRCFFYGAIANEIKRAAAPGWAGDFDTMLTFGDSYTDENRLNYFVINGGAAPPVGWIAPISDATQSGGYSWARYASWYTGSTLYNYAVSGASCSNEITPRWLSLINNWFPSVAEYQIPAFTADYRNNTFPGLDWSRTVINIWIGGNDLGADALISQSQVKGKTLVDYTRCVFGVMRNLYQLGARRMVLMNVAPLELSPLYAANSPPGPNRYWFLKPLNSTEVSVNMRGQVAAANEIFTLGTRTMEFEGASIAVMDVNGLMSDIYNNPQNYLNGTLPLDVDGYNEHCSWLYVCYWYRRESRDSFMWFNELHPSEQVGRVIAREWVETARGVGRWASYW